jgi:16S rRNA (cytosine967-C5)-methyltransferase
VIDAYFRAHRMMGARDRAFAAEAVYGCLRQRRVLEHVVARARAHAPVADAGNVWASAGGYDVRGEAAHLVAAYMLREGGWGRDDLERAGYPGDAAALCDAARETAPEVLPLPVRANLPDDLARSLVHQYGEAEALALADALNRPATLDIRANPLKTERAGLQARLHAEGIDMVPTPLSPLGLRRADRAALFRCASFQEGWFEVQDEGSQLIALLLQPRPHERFADFCAGAGGKSLHLGALLRNTGVVYAMDVSARRLQELRPRLRRSGLQNVRIVTLQHERDRGLKRLAGKLDGVLVDAPCSGMGTLRRNPDLKWRPLALDELRSRQVRILTAAARLVRKGGRLVYATCSVLRQENQDVVTAFLAAHPTFARGDLAGALGEAGVPASDVVTVEGDLCLLPHRHGTDGFYATLLERAEPRTRATDPRVVAAEAPSAAADLDPRRNGC